MQDLVKNQPFVDLLESTVHHASDKKLGKILSRVERTEGEVLTLRMKLKRKTTNLENWKTKLSSNSTVAHDIGVFSE